MAIIKPEQLSSGTYSISGSFSGSFHGDGSDLNNLPSNVISTGSYADFPDTGSEGYIYIDNSANIGYLWDSGSIPPTYVNIAGPSTPPEVLPLTFANAATVLALVPSPLYNNGISGSGAVLTGSINGVLSDNTNPGKIDYVYTPVVGDVILVKNQLTGSQNGLYTITSTGSVSSKYVLTRTDEYDVSSELFPLQVNILVGTNNNNKSFIQSTANPVIGTSSLVFSAASPAISVAPQIAFVDTVIDTPLTNIVYATGSFSSVVPGNGATITSTVSGSLGTWNGLSVNTNSNITGSFTKVLVTNQTNPAYNGDYSVLATGSSTVFWKLQRINNNASGFDRYTRFFLVSNTSSSKAGRMYFTRPNSPVLTNATIGTAPINIFEYGGGTSTSSFPFTGSALITGSLGVTGSVSSTQGFTGSLLGTASLASTASFVVTAQTASYVLNAVSSSFATTASYALNALSASYAPSVSPFPFTGSALITGSLGVTGSIYSRINSPATSLWQTHFAGERFDAAALQGRIYIKTNWPSAATEDFYIGKNSGSADTNTSTNGGIYYGHQGVFTVRNTQTSGFYGVTLNASGNLTQRVGIDTGTDSNGDGWSLRNFTNSTDYINFAHNSGRVGIGWNNKTTSLLSASLDIKASSSAATDIAFRVRNSANTQNLMSLSGDGQFTIGQGATTAASTAVAIGLNSTAGTISSTAIGGYVTVDAASDSSTAVGYGSSITSTGYRGVALGFTNTVAAGQGIAIGERSSISAGGTNGIAIGSAAGVSAASSFMAGAGTTNSVASSNAFANGLNGFSFFNDVNSNYVVNSAIIPVNNVSYINTTKNVLYLGTAVKPTTTIKNGVQSYTNYRTISAATVTPGSTATGVANLKTLTFSAGTNMSALTVGTRIIVTNNIGEQTHANIVSVVGLVVTIDSALVNINVSTLNANATTVANSTIVIISDFHQEIRNDKGDIIKLYTQAAVTSSQGIADALTNLGLLTGSSVIVTTPTSGPFGIANLSGSYTYYTSFSSSVAAAPTGSTVEMFADVVETGAVTITLKNGVNINGNGHTYTLNTSTTSSNFIDGGAAVVMSMSNITLVRTGSGAGTIIGLSNASNRIVGVSTFLKVQSNNSFGITNYGGAVFSGYINGFTVTATGTSSTGIYLIRANIDGCNSVATANGIQLNIGTLTNSYGESTGAGNGIDVVSSGFASNCNGKSNTGYGISTGLPTYNSAGYSAGNYGIYCPSGNLNNCNGTSAATYGIWGYSEKVNNCNAFSSGGPAMFLQNGNANNCTAYSTVNSAMNIYDATTTHNCTFNTLSGATAVIATNAISGASMKNCVVINNWNSTSGHGVQTNANLTVFNCSIKVSNTSANCLNATSAITIKYANNVFEGSTTSVNANITQGTTNTHDNQGNIII